jgi:glyceraldehyde 3-phosphate dehydrogenase
MKIGINGFGRMGRLATRVAWDWPDFDITHVNEIKGGATCAAHLLTFDTVHGRWDRSVEAAGADALSIGGQAVSFSEHGNPGEVDWVGRGVELVVECTGKFRTPEALQPYFDQGVKKVIVAAPVKDTALNVVMGCNDELYNPDVHHLLTAASCTTNCLAPVVKVVHEAIGIKHGTMTTIHDVTNTQVVVDAPHADLRRARSALNALIPTTTGSAKAITMIYPELEGKLDGLAVRVPLLNASLVVCVLGVDSPTGVGEVNRLFADAARGALRGILGFETRPLVSTDYTNDTRSGIVDGPLTRVVDGSQVNIFAWYDNEIGYVNRMMELVRKVVCAMETG